MVDIDTRIQKSIACNIFRQPRHRRPMAPNDTERGRLLRNDICMYARKVTKSTFWAP
ncbi:hypothetical protein TSAR_003899 [Trichomalopsis sarcophagae]|uniref:Uncharacterized protein n=1 Tax=Trichomalopsis sarcophagae TaxID=543379 RepID=A0A232ELS2_9HYME|nr:hypothetical protein TSAR_003899 [Trichomalopsis sarcophagae]